MSCRRHALVLPLAVASLIGSGCVTGRLGLEGRTPEALAERACAPGKGVKSVKGSVWLKAQSKDASGQFPAAVRADESGSARLEVTNLLGGTEAVITVSGGKYLIETPKAGRKAEEGYGSWGGIPLRWAVSLFLGRMPCPAAPVRSLVDGDRLVLETASSLDGGAERYEYSFRDWGGKPWPDRLVWQRLGGGPSMRLELALDDPDERTLSARKWEARSEVGEVKVRWRDRVATP